MWPFKLKIVRKLKTEIETKISKQWRSPWVGVKCNTLKCSTHLCLRIFVSRDFSLRRFYYVFAFSNIAYDLVELHIAFRLSNFRCWFCQWSRFSDYCYDSSKQSDLWRRFLAWFTLHLFVFFSDQGHKSKFKVTEWKISVLFLEESASKIRKSSSVSTA